jgi:hypothetical protein
VQAYAFADGNYLAPPLDLWCNAADNCDASGVDPTKATGPDFCKLTGNYEDHCWWHIAPQDVWQIVEPFPTCNDCGLQHITYPAGAPDPGAEPIAANSRRPVRNPPCLPTR